MTRLGAIAALTFLLGTSTVDAQDAAEVRDACLALPDGMPDGPMRTSFYDGELGRLRSVCPRTEVAVGGAGLVVADFDDFYGNVVGSAFLWGSWELVPGRTELFASVEALRYQTVISSISDEHLGPGHTSIGATQRIYRADGFTASTRARIVLPTAFLLYDNAWPFGLDLGVGALWSRAPRWRLSAHLGSMLSAALTAGASQPRAGVRLGVDGSFRIWPAFSIVAQVETGMGWRSTLDLLAAGLGLRFAGGDHFGLELGAMIPVAGADRTLLTATLAASWRL